MEKLPFVSQFLDSGARGVLAAKVGSVSDAEQVVQAVRYPPLGDRGACLGTHANDYGWLEWSDHVAAADRSTVVGIALEGPRAIADADAILSIPGLDFVFVGIFDLAASLGLRPGLDLPEIQDAVRTIAESAARHGVAAGAWAPTPLMAQHWLDLGVTFLPVSLDVLMWRTLCMSTVADWRARVDARGVPAD
jgi:4-hydroxy-2-oxoheptanedioate aldolase